MSYRNATLYVQGKTLQRLRLVRKLYPHYITEKNELAGDMSQRECSIDEMADRIINGAIDDQFPAALALEKEMARVEKEAMEKLGRSTKP